MDMLPSLDSREPEAIASPVKLPRRPELRHTDGADENQDVKASQGLFFLRCSPRPRAPHTHGRQMRGHNLIKTLRHAVISLDTHEA